MHRERCIGASASLKLAVRKLGRLVACFAYGLKSIIHTLLIPFRAGLKEHDRTVIRHEIRRQSMTRMALLDIIRSRA